MTQKTIRFFFVISMLTVVVTPKSLAQNNSVVMSLADTTNFSVNSAGGWQLLNSFVAAYGTDSVQLEILAQHANNIKWSQEQYVGKVKTVALIPLREQIVS